MKVYITKKTLSRVASREFSVFCGGECWVSLGKYWINNIAHDEGVSMFGKFGQLGRSIEARRCAQMVIALGYCNTPRIFFFWRMCNLCNEGIMRASRNGAEQQKNFVEE
jgi:hypothetical protein